MLILIQIKHLAYLCSGERHKYYFSSLSLQRSVMRTPVGKGGGLNVTVDIEVNLMNHLIS